MKVTVSTLIIPIPYRTEGYIGLTDQRLVVVATCDSEFLDCNMDSILAVDNETNEAGIDIADVMNDILAEQYIKEGHDVKQNKWL